MKKKKIWSTITRFAFAFMFVASWAVLGVALALKTAKVEISGGITFTATDVYATISGSVTGSKSSNPIDEHPIEIDSKTSADFTIDESWTKMNLDYQNASTPIVVTIKIENKSSDRPFWIVFADNIEHYSIKYSSNRNEINAIEEGHNSDVIRKVDETTLTGRYTPIQLAGNSSVTLETTISVHNGNFAVDDNFKLGIELIGENAIKDESEYTKLTFNTDDTKKTASVKASNKDIEGEVVIPALFSKDGEIYTVNEIEETVEGTWHEGTSYWDYDIDDAVYVQGYYERDGGFGDCKNVTSIYIPATITTIGTYAFAGCGASSIISETYIAWGVDGDAVNDYDQTTSFLTSRDYNIYRD